MPSVKRPLDDATDEQQLVVQLLCTNDTHSQLEPFVATNGSEKGRTIGGVAQRAAVFEAMRAECPATLTLDAGDVLVGTPFFEFLRGEADLAIMHELGYDAVAIGNHDFDGSDPAGGDGPEARWLGFFKALAAQHAPGLQLLCANVRDEATGAQCFAPHAVFHSGGVKVGVAAVLGQEAWDVTGVPSRAGLRCDDYMEAARAAAYALTAQCCDVLVCLSHTGVGLGDKDLARLGLYDVIFSGHEHHYEKLGTLERVEGGEGRRLGLLSPGFAQGGGVSWANLVLDRSTRRISSYNSGIVAVDASSGAPRSAPIAERVRAWGAAFEATCQQTLGRAGGQDLPIPGAEEQLLTTSRMHAALSEATLDTLRARLPDQLSAAAICICNRYSASFALTAGQTLTLGELLRLRAYDNPLIVADLSGELLGALLDRNARFAGGADFLYFDPGVVYELRPRGGGVLPEHGFSKEALDGGALELVRESARVAGAPLDREAGWYQCVVSNYVLDTLLKDMPERRRGVRRERPAGCGEREVLQAFLQRGGELGSGA